MNFTLQCSGSIVIPTLEAHIAARDVAEAISRAQETSRHIASRNIYRFALFGEDEKLVASWSTEMVPTVIHAKVAA